MFLGVDLGATNTVAAVWDGKLRMVEITSGGATSLPSVVCIANGEILVGQDAVDAGRLYPDFDFRNWKRLLGEKWHADEDTGYQTCEGLDENNQPTGMLAYRGPVRADGTLSTYTPVELSSYVIGEIVQAANQYLAPHDTVTGAVIGIPATFEPHQIAAVKEAARMAGLENVSTLEEPVAAAIANGVDARKAKCIFVVDFGGSTLDTSIIRAGGGHIPILAKNGIGDLGGADFDKRIADFVVNLFRTEHGKDLMLRDAAMTRIMVEAELAKKRLTDAEETTFRVDNIDRTAEGVSLHMIYKLDRRILAELTHDLLDRMVNAFKATIEDAKRKDLKFGMADIQEIHLVGGMTRMPIVRQACTEFFGKEPKKDESPERVVAQGLAIKAAILEGRRQDVNVQNILGSDIALETRNNVPAIIIGRGTNFPLKKSFKLRNADDDQSEISVRLLFATRPRAQDCHVLEARDVPIDPGPAETCEIVLTVEVDDEGMPSIVDVAA